MLVDLLFFLAFSALLAHELDAVHKREWRLLFILRKMPEDTARRVFVLIHVPVIAILLWLVMNPVDSIRYWAMLGMDTFMVVHAGLHFRLRNHDANRFGTMHSRMLIYGPALTALIHISL